MRNWKGPAARVELRGVGQPAPLNPPGGMSRQGQPHIVVGAAFGWLDDQLAKSMRKPPLQADERFPLLPFAQLIPLSLGMEARLFLSGCAGLLEKSCGRST